MIVHPQFDPVALQLGPLAIHWYGLMYLAGFMTFLWLGRKRIAILKNPQINTKLLDDLLFYGVLGVILGGRLGYVLLDRKSVV
jgi:phosphatidylglycerol:prolipoprotein diacylglycerol transferase